MNDPYDRFFENPLYGLFGPLVWPGSWSRIFYLLLGFPIGLAWFVFYVTGLSLGVGLFVLAVGALILTAVFLAALPLGAGERWLANRMLDADIGPTGFTVPDEAGGLVEWLKETAANPVTWKTHLFLLARFPLGLASWLAVVVSLSVAGAFTFAPVILALGGDVRIGSWAPTTTPEAFLLTGVGLVAFVASIHLLNGLAWMWAAFARMLLGRRVAEPAEEGVEPAIAGQAG